jgi:uroporphyrinogen III methyltransferase/synthase
VLITRPAGQAKELQALLEERGASVVSMPAIVIEDPQDYGPLDQAIQRLEDFHYLIFTSVNGVARFFDRLHRMDKDARALSGLVTACIGPRTAQELGKHGIRCDLMPDRFVAEALLDVFPERLEGKRILIPRAEEARAVLPEGLTARGAKVHLVTAYRTVAARPACALPPSMDMAVFTSSSAVEHFMAAARLPEGCRIAAIGPVTAGTLRNHGLKIDVQAEEYSLKGLVEALEDYAKKNG